MAPPAVPSFAARTPSTLLLRATSAPCISFWALSGFQPGVSYSLPYLTLPSRTLCAPCLNSLALLSAGSPLISTICGLVLLPIAVSRALPCRAPTAALSWPASPHQVRRRHPSRFNPARPGPGTTLLNFYLTLHPSSTTPSLSLAPSSRQAMGPGGGVRGNRSSPKPKPAAPNGGVPL